MLTSAAAVDIVLRFHWQKTSWSLSSPLKFAFEKKSVQPSISHPGKTMNPLLHLRWTDLASNGNGVLIILWYEASCAAEKWKHVSLFYIMMSSSDGLGCDKPGNILMIAFHLSNDYFFKKNCSCVFHLVVYFLFILEIWAIFGVWAGKTCDNKDEWTESAADGGMDVGNCACILVQSISGVCVTDEECVVFTA